MRICCLRGGLKNKGKLLLLLTVANCHQLASLFVYVNHINTVSGVYVVLSHLWTSVK